MLARCYMEPKKEDELVQQVFTSILEEADPDFQLAQRQKELERAKKRQRIFERYTDFCIGVVQGEPLKVYLKGLFKFKFNQIIPERQRVVKGVMHSFFSSCIAFKDYQMAYSFLTSQTVLPELATKKAIDILNLPAVYPVLKEELMCTNLEYKTGKAFRNTGFKNLWQMMKEFQPFPLFMQKVLFPDENNDVLDVRKKGAFSTDGVNQTALSFLISKGYLYEALDYMAHLPDGFKTKDVCDLLTDKRVKFYLGKLTKKDGYHSKEEKFFLSTLERCLPTRDYLALVYQKESVTPYSERYCEDERDFKMHLSSIQRNRVTTNRFFPVSSLTNIRD